MAIFFVVLYTVLLLIRPQEWPIFALPETLYVRFTLAICAAFFLIHRGKNWDLPQTRFILLFALTIELSLIFSGWLGSILVYGSNFIQQSLLPFIVLTTLLDTRKKLYIILVLIVITSMIMVLNGYYQANDVNGIGIIGNLAYMRAESLRIRYIGFFNDPNDVGMFLAMSIPIMFFLKHKSPVLLRLPLWGAIFATLYGIYLTNSRGTLLAMVALCAYWIWTTYGIRKFMYASTVLGPALLVVLTVFRTISTEEDSAEGRLDAWYEGYQMLIDNPLFGVGFSQFLEYHFRTAHNSFVLVAAELGLVGAYAWCGLLTSTMLVLFRIANKSYLPVDLKHDDPRRVAADEEALIAKMFIFVLIAFFSAAFFLSRTYTPFFYFFLGLSASSLARVRRIFPDLSAIFTYKELLKMTNVVTLTASIGIYAVVMLFL